MKTYKELRPTVKTGDVLLVKGSGIISKLIRAFTGESISHVAMFIWLGDGLFVIEFVEFKGWQLTPASLRIKDMCEDADKVFYGVAPEMLRTPEAEKLMNNHAFSLRQGKYGYLTLFKIWLAQIQKKPIPVGKVVCSTYVESIWKSGGHEMSYTADPANIGDDCQRTVPINCIGE